MKKLVYYATLCGICVLSSSSANAPTAQAYAAEQQFHGADNIPSVVYDSNGIIVFGLSHIETECLWPGLDLFCPP